MTEDRDTIVAVATAPGRGGIGIVRLSGPRAINIGETLCGRTLVPREAQLAGFKDHNGQNLDQGIALCFAAPASYTGEHVVELQGHGSPVVLDLIVARAVALGARMARPGEFTERAYLNGQLDLAQAEAVADLINAGTDAAARAAMRSLSGEFSNRVNACIENLTTLRIMIEAAIDFPEEEIDFLSDSQYVERIDALVAEVATLAASAQQGVLMGSGVRVVLAGKPNAGKSSLMNRLAGEDRAIVSATPGTTRDLIEVNIQIDGLPVTLIDTAGLRDSADDIENEGIRRAHAAMDQASLVLLVRDDTAGEDVADIQTLLPQDQDSPVIVVLNKTDLSGNAAGRNESDRDTYHVSALTGDGIAVLLDAIKDSFGFSSIDENGIVARRRHVESIREAAQHVNLARVRLVTDQAGELAAEELRLAQSSFGNITGAVSSDDLLGRIFSSFCIGK